MSAPRCTRAPEAAAAAAAVRHRAALPVIETGRLRLRAPEIGDFALWHRIHTGPGAEFLDGPLAPETAWEGFCTYLAGWLLHGHGPFVVVHKADGTTLGFVFLGYEWEDEEPELGWFFAEEARGRGYATEAAAAVRDWGLGLLDGFVSCVDPANAPSTALARRLGAVRDAAASARLGTDIWRHGAARARP